LRGVFVCDSGSQSYVEDSCAALALEVAKIQQQGHFSARAVPAYGRLATPLQVGHGLHAELAQKIVREIKKLRDMRAKPL
jgi:hypothetical protein